MSRQLSRRGLLLGAASLAGAPLLASLPLPAAAQTAYASYLLVHFTGESSDGEQIYLSHSDNGLNWTDLNGGGVVLRSAIGTRGVRDPILVRSPQGDRYWIVATDLRIASGTSWDDASNRGSLDLVVWESTDLVNWGTPRLLNVAGSISAAGNAWAPEAIWDSSAGNYVLYWATNSTLNGIRKARIWYSRTSDFRSITAPQVYIDRPGNQGLIDTQIIEANAGPYRYYRASKEGNITLEGSNSIIGGWNAIGDLSHLGTVSTQVEGPMWAKFNDRNEWALWLDQYATGRGYMPVATTAPGTASSYRTVSGYNLGGTHKRHGFILNLTAAERGRVLGRWGTAQYQRLQSYNFQDRYVRHYNMDVRIDPNPSPAQDAHFRVLPGLAGTGTVSFESVNYPGHFLRHSNFDFALAADDGSSSFAQDATFRQVAGLANSSWSSFQSYNHSGRYLRHYNYELRLDPVGDDTARADATFRLVS
ncbi:glycoside hydrolase family 43 protein [Glycomyces sp. NRRL B-16210]|uniref:glycoside hydrolase family 43 protein n=1 Tax=Glycomyces sp. NRRL B-16210 TaxID=1463821 RepID=UPI0004BFBCD2|nr:glycoside hydrolase family 43 protein [Glycomyces sp. NRRL B-16210]